MFDLNNEKEHYEAKWSCRTTQKIVNNLINENIFPLKVSSLRQDV